MSSQPTQYEGSCLCGQVKLQVEGPPLREGYCHCKTCRTWHAAPINAVAVWPSEAVRVIQGEELIANFQDGHSNRHWCQHCGSGLMNRPGGEWTVVYSVVLADSGYVHQPSYHIHCDEAVLDMRDDVPKFAGWRDSEPWDEPPQTGPRPS